MPFKVDFATKNKEVIAKFKKLFVNQLTIVPRLHLDTHKKHSTTKSLNIGVIAFDESAAQGFCEAITFDGYFYTNDLLSFEAQPFQKQNKYDFLIYLIDGAYSKMEFNVVKRPQNACIVMLSSAGNNCISKKELEQKAIEMNVTNIMIIHKDENDINVCHALRYLITAEIFKTTHRDFYNIKDALLKMEKTRLEAYFIHYQSIEQRQLISPKVALNIEKLLKTVNNDEHTELLRHINDYLAKPTIDAAEKLKKYANELAAIKPDHSMEAKISLTLLSLLGLVSTAILWKQSENIIASGMWWGGQLVSDVMLMQGIAMFAAPRNKMSVSIVALTEDAKDLPSLRLGK